eukprot:TRINITY_DN382_c0_g1_i1.p1 TRINITY_DN382_c0_g1~~TRINITY_DN382_c0_g1_i1.p1  ORF type:complete len:518 (-),score=66.21 TRINITY_DN382_c0_g1_i1:2859-4412(-)
MLTCTSSCFHGSPCALPFSVIALRLYSSILMAILTNIDVSVFNIIRYLIINIFVDIVVRNGLDSLAHFHRRFNLFRGRSVSVSGLRIDRYNLLRIVKSARVLSASLLFAVTIIAYCVEVGLEYAVDSRAIRYPARGNITRVQYETGVCSLEHMVCDNLQHIASMAEQCVQFEDGVYRFHSPVWVRDEDGSFALLCEPVPQNVLYEGNAIYGDHFESEGASQSRALIDSLTRSSLKSFGDEFQPLATVDVSSSDVFQRNTFVTPTSVFSTHSFITRISDTRVQCIGFTLGRAPEEMVLLQFLGCVDGFDDNSSLLITSGTSSIDVGTRVDAEGPQQWSTQVSFEVRKRVPNYFRGVGDNRSNAQANATAYATFLSRSSPMDIINLNKYAILYRFCDRVSVPVWNGTWWQEEYELSSSQLRLTATVEEWGILLISCWVFLVTVAQLFVSWVAIRNKMPNKLFGERHLLRRWAEENCLDGERGEGDDDAFLSVQEGVKSDRITATLRRRTLHRDKSKALD